MKPINNRRYHNIINRLLRHFQTHRHIMILSHQTQVERTVILIIQNLLLHVRLNILPCRVVLLFLSDLEIPMTVLVERVGKLKLSFPHFTDFFVPAVGMVVVAIPAAAA